jgi:hypothetical protein
VEVDAGSIASLALPPNYGITERWIFSLLIPEFVDEGDVVASDVPGAWARVRSTSIGI